MLPGMLSVHVTELWIPRGRRAAIQSTFYIMSLPQLPLVEATVLQPMCAPPEINVSVDSLISRTDIDILRERNLPLLLPPEVEL